MLRLAAQFFGKRVRKVVLSNKGRFVWTNLTNGKMETRIHW